MPLPQLPDVDGLNSVLTILGALGLLIAVWALFRMRSQTRKLKEELEVLRYSQDRMVEMVQSQASAEEILSALPGRSEPVQPKRKFAVITGGKAFGLGALGTAWLAMKEHPRTVALAGSAVPLAAVSGIVINTPTPPQEGGDSNQSITPPSSSREAPSTTPSVTPPRTTTPGAEQGPSERTVTRTPGQPAGSTETRTLTRTETETVTRSRDGGTETVTEPPRTETETTTVTRQPDCDVDPPPVHVCIELPRGKQR